MTRHSPLLTRRQMLGAALLASAAPLAARPHPARGARNLLYPQTPLSLRIEQTQLEIGRNVVIPTTTYNGSAPGPILRLREGERVRIAVENATTVEELVHWHGLHIPSPADGAMEEGSPMIPPGHVGQYDFVPAPSGTRWYHTHTMAGADLTRGGYSGQFGFVFVAPRHDPGHYDREMFMAVHHWQGTLHDMGAPVSDQMVAYRHATFDGRLHADAEPIRVRQGERVLFRFLNASATQNTALAMAGHRFTVIALDGNPVPHPASVQVLELGVAERIDAIVEMDNPGVWMLAATDPGERTAGLARTIEYENRTGPAQWHDPVRSDWSYHSFEARTLTPPPPVDGIIPMVFSKAFLKVGGMDLWRINDRPFPDAPPIRVEAGKRYRFRFMNASREPHPVHFHRHSFEITAISGIPTRGIVKDTVVLPLYGSVDVDWVADNPGPSLFHCHQQIHMDYGFMRMVQYA